MQVMRVLVSLNPHFNFRCFKHVFSIQYMVKCGNTCLYLAFSPRAESLLCQGSFIHIQLIKVHAKDSTRCYSSNSGGGERPPKGLPKLWLKFPQHASLWTEYTWCHLPSLPWGNVCGSRSKPRELEKNGWAVFLIFVYLYCEPLSESRCASKHTQLTVFFGVTDRKEPNIDFEGIKLPV